MIRQWLVASDITDILYRITVKIADLGNACWVDRPCFFTCLE
jgi:hypothetical protein